MQQSLHSTAKLLSLAAAVSFATACATVPPAASAQGNVATNIPVLVMSEDENPDSHFRRDREDPPRRRSAPPASSRRRRT